MWSKPTFFKMVAIWWLSDSTCSETNACAVDFGVIEAELLVEVGATFGSVLALTFLVFSAVALSKFIFTLSRTLELSNNWIMMNW